MNRRRIRVTFSALLGLLAALVLGMVVTPIRAAPGDNYAYDDQFTSARMRWWRDAHFGMFIHFGVYAKFGGVYGNCRDAEWIMRNCNIPVSTYESYAAQFNPTQFNATQIVQTAKNAGYKYIIITAKHHDGFNMFCTSVTTYDICGPLSDVM